MEEYSLSGSDNDMEEERDYDEMEEEDANLAIMYRMYYNNTNEPKKSKNKSTTTTVIKENIPITIQKEKNEVNLTTTSPLTHKNIESPRIRIINKERKKRLELSETYIKKYNK